MALTQYKPVFVNTRGEMVSSSMQTMFNGNIVNESNLNFHGYAYFYTYMSGSEVTYFDGDNVYTHTFTGSTSVTIDNNYDECNNVGCFIAYVTDYNGVEGDYATVLINKDKVYVLNVLNSSTYLYANSFVYNYAEFIFTSIYNDDNSIYETFQFWDINGNLIESIDVSSYNFDTVERYFYGTGKLQLIFNNSLDTNQPFYMINYDEALNVFQGDDMTWWHERGDHFSNYKVYAKNKNGLDPYYYESTNSSYTPESVAILFFSGTVDFNYFLNYSVAYADISYVFPGYAYGNYTFASNSTSSLLRIPSSVTDTSAIYPTSDDIIFNYNLIDSASGDLNALVITPTGINTTQIISDISAINSGSYSSIVFRPVGDYNMYGYYNVSDDQTYYKMIRGSTVVDTLILTGSQDNYRFRYNSLFIRTWSGPNYDYYFNAATNAFTQLDTFYSQRYFTYGFGDSGINNGTMLLIKPEYYTPTGSITGRVLTANSITDEVTLPYSNSIETSYQFYMGSNSIVYAYVDSPDNVNYELHIAVYDLNLNLKKTVSNPLSGSNTFGVSVVNDRVFVEVGEAPGKYVNYLITQTTVQKKRQSTSGDLTIDDGVWFD